MYTVCSFPVQEMKDGEETHTQIHKHMHRHIQIHTHACSLYFPISGMTPDIHSDVGFRTHRTHTHTTLIEHIVLIITIQTHTHTHVEIIRCRFAHAPAM